MSQTNDMLYIIGIAQKSNLVYVIKNTPFGFKPVPFYSQLSGTLRFRGFGYVPTSKAVYASRDQLWRIDGGRVWSTLEVMTLDGILSLNEMKDL